MSRRSRRSRRRAEGANSDKQRQGLSASQSQHMARVNVSKETWKAFRAEGVIRSMSVADYLGHLVTKEMRRVLEGTALPRRVWLARRAPWPPIRLS
jgi:hypothetical protein